MVRYFVRYSSPNRSFSVIDRQRRNEFGEPYVVVPLTTQYEAGNIVWRLNNGETIEQVMTADLAPDEADDDLDAAFPEQAFIPR